MLMIEKIEGEKVIFLKFLCRELDSLLSVKNSSPRVFFFSRQRNSSPRVFFFENIFFYSRQRGLRRELEIKLSPKNIALGEDSVSCSETYFNRLTDHHLPATFF
jgi:hypothetical protein